MTRRFITLVAGLVVAAAVVSGTQTPALQSAQPAPAQPTNLGADPNGNPLRLAIKTGHVSNYDEAKVKPYVLPDPLVFADGSPVRTAAEWTRRRRAELIKLYETEIYGRVPASVPKVSWAVSEQDPLARNGKAKMTRVIGTIGSGPDAPRMNVLVYTPAAATKPVPVVLMINFASNAPRAGGAGTQAGGGAAPTPPARGPASPDPPIADDLLARGWGYAMVGYQDIQPDRANSFNQGVIGLTLAAGQTQPAPNEWGTISAWAWGVSRVVDYLTTDKAVDAKRIALQGFSRLGKTVLWAAAQDERIAAVFSACAGEMGSALARRDWGETLDDMAQNFPWQFAGNLQKYPGRWNDLPVDAHMLIALSAPRPVFLTGGTSDQWSDPKGEFLSAVAAGPVYRMLGKNDLGTTEVPPLDTALTAGDLGWLYHTGGHAVPAGDWNAFVMFLAKYF